jgi:hypothetical protein
MYIHSRTGMTRSWWRTNSYKEHVTLYILYVYIHTHTHTHTHIQNGDGAKLVAHELILGTRDFLDRLERAVAPKPEEQGTTSV